MVKAVLFDMDGVLVDSFKTHFCAFNATIRKYGGGGVSPEVFREKFWGRYMEEDFETVFPNISGEKLREVVEEYPLQVEKFAGYTRVYPGTKRVLEELKRRGLRIGVVSSSQERIVDTLMNHVGLYNYFDIAVCGDQVKRPKPAPDGIIEACRSLGIEPSEAFYIGDNIRDVVAGKSAGCLTIGITTTSNREELKGADIIIEDLAQLLDLET